MEDRERTVGAPPLSGLASDFRLGFRSLAKARGFAAVAMMTIALGVGANAAMFAVTNAVLWKPLPFPQSERLVALWPERPWSVPLREDVVQRTASYSAVISRKPSR
jgi:hypothetical protein